jgi:hypothetical protein
MRTPVASAAIVRLALAVAVVTFGAGCGSEKKSGSPVISHVGNIEGRILVDGASGLPSSIVSYEGETQERRSRLTNEEGLFVFRDAEAGEGLLWIAPPPGYALAVDQPNPARVLVPEGGLTQVDIRMLAVDDTVVTDSLHAGFIDVRAEDELLPANGVYVQATGTGSEGVHGATTAGQGQALLVVPEGTYAITAIVPSWYNLVDIEPNSVTASGGHSVPVLIHVQLVGPLPDGGIEIFVANPDSVPVDNPVPEGIPVTITRKDGPVFTDQSTTDALGRAHFDAAPGVYEVSIVVPADWALWPNYPNPIDVQVTSATSTWARFYMSPIIR